MRIDVRNRPPTPEFETFFTPQILRFVSRRLGVPYATHFETHSPEDWYRDIESAGLDHVLIVGRNTRSAAIANDHVAELQAKFSPIVIGAAGIDVSGGLHDPRQELRRSVKDLNLHVAAIDPGCAYGMPPKHAGFYPDDARVFPFYEAAISLDVPVVLMTGPFSGRDISYSRPEHVDVVATEFPELKMILGHGCYPYITEAIGVAYKHRNIYISPDCYIFSPGGEQYVQAANRLLPRQILFGSAYPFSADIHSVITENEGLGFAESAWPAYMGGNAEFVLKNAINATQ